MNAINKEPSLTRESKMSDLLSSKGRKSIKIEGELAKAILDIHLESKEGDILKNKRILDYIRTFIAVDVNSLKEPMIFDVVSYSPTTFEANYAYVITHITDEDAVKSNIDEIKEFVGDRLKTDKSYYSKTVIENKNVEETNFQRIEIPNQKFSNIINEFNVDGKALFGFVIENET